MKERGKEKKTKEETKGKRACMRDPSWLSVLHGPRAIQGKKRCAPLPRTLLHFLHGVQAAPALPVLAPLGLPAAAKLHLGLAACGIQCARQEQQSESANWHGIPRGDWGRLRGRSWVISTTVHCPLEAHRALSHCPSYHHKDVCGQGCCCTEQWIYTGNQFSRRQETLAYSSHSPGLFFTRSPPNLIHGPGYSTRTAEEQRSPCLPAHFTLTKGKINSVKTRQPLLHWIRIT